jgi:hypothetical protein
MTGLDALTEGEGGFEEALLDAIAADEALLTRQSCSRRACCARRLTPKTPPTGT